MIKAYETEGHGIYWQVFKWELGKESDVFIGEMDSPEEILAYAREQKLPAILYTLDWWQTFESEGK
jgi:hypothetical protein